MVSKIDFDPDGDVVIKVPRKTECDDEPAEIHMRVSSRHLSLASPVFKVLLNGKFQEACSFRDSGNVTISLPDDDPNVLETLFNIIHGRLRQVPPVYKRQWMCKLAVYVDKYELHEITSFFFKCWKNEADPFPEVLDKDLLDTLALSWIFSDDDLFSKMARVAFKQADGPIVNESPLSLPLLNDLLGNAAPSYTKWILLTSSLPAVIDRERLVCLQNSFDGLQKIVDTYLKQTVCTNKADCDAMVFGGLLKELARKSLYPIPRAPFPGIKVGYVESSLSERYFSVPKLCPRTDATCNKLPRISKILLQVRAHSQRISLRSVRAKMGRVDKPESPGT